MNPLRNVRGIWLPASDAHLAGELALPQNVLVGGKATYQKNKFDAALKRVVHRGHAVDVGANVGLWTRLMEVYFSRVTAIEPVALHRQCMALNCHGKAKVLAFAAGSEDATVRMVVPNGHTSGAHVGDYGEAVTMKPIDRMRIGAVDFMKFDVEGFEYDAILGAEKTIKRCKPVLVVEQKPDNAERYGRGQRDAVKLLTRWGMREVENIGGDHIMVF